MTVRIPRVTNPLLSRCRQWQSDTHGTVFQNFSRFCDGRDTRGISPVMLRMDNGPEFISLALAEWAEKHAVKLEFIQLGKPKQNAE
ncbi:transposase family protein [Salmonella enterica]|nr:transposase family protein [Salmonella enterica]